MKKRNKKFLTVLACAGMLASVGVVMPPMNQTAHTVQAARRRRSVASRSYGVDVSVYQSTSVHSAARSGAKFAVVKVSEGTAYRNPKARAQIASAKANRMMPMAYHFALFGANSSAARREANYAVSSAKAMGLKRGSYIACDWETGDGNNVNGGVNGSTNAIISFMRSVKRKGYKPLLYSGASLLRNNVNTARVNRAFPNSLWVASYATMGRIDRPNFGYFPSMNGVAIWQFTDNWRGLNVDGNISLLPLSISGRTNVSQAPKAKLIRTQKTVSRRAEIYNRRGHKIGRHYNRGGRITVFGGSVRIKKTLYYRTGSNAYVRVKDIDAR